RCSTRNVIFTNSRRRWSLPLAHCFFLFAEFRWEANETLMAACREDGGATLASGARTAAAPRPDRQTLAPARCQPAKGDERHQAGLDIAEEVGRLLAANYSRNAQAGPEKRWMVSMNWATWMGFDK